MTLPIASVDRLTTEHTRLTTAVRQLEGVFVQQLFSAMRETVPTDGITSGGSGEQMFTSLMDQHLSELVPAKWDTDLGAALLRQFQALQTPQGPREPNAA